MKPIRRLVASNGKYTNGEGQTKKRWQRVGTLFKGDDGEISVKLDCLPIGPEFSGWLNAYPIEDQDQPQTQNEPTTTRNVHDQHHAAAADKGDDIPF